MRGSKEEAIIIAKAHDLVL